ncbi:MAG: phenylalanine--tRNA ligase subunit beta [Actinobacteria bacterium]|nr:phenylalanine--tRNA ligase subunit beta [Actinomycetota bacterium]MBU1494227.1 phenylalanine--tRNA ligase subunit beta [Actinomycetota bacterium]
MKLSVGWINEFVDLPINDPGELCDVFNQLGLEVETWQAVEAGFSGVIVAEVTEVLLHPNADKLRVVTLDTGSGLHTVVCGAWNFEAGATVPLAMPGAVLPGGFEVGSRKIRGVESPGMICSERELGLGEGSEGILMLGEGYAPLGADFASTLPYPDVVFDLDITPNRPDAMSVYGVARDLAACFGLPLRGPNTGFEEEGQPTTASVRVEDSERCPRFTAREIRDLAIGPSPLWMRLRLRDCGVRAINNVVDVTNYVTLELGQPLHAFDLDRVPEETLVIRRAAPGEHLTTLDSIDRVLSDEDLLVAGPSDGLALAGIMGGENSEVAPDTTRVLLEVAHFSAPHTLLSGWRQKLRSEASARFERGVDPELPPIASGRAAALMGRLAGGAIAPGFIDIYPTPIEPVVVELPAAETERLLGVAIPPSEIAGILTRLGCEVEGDGPFRVTVPTYRPDVTRPADLVEEIARLYGYDNIPSSLPRGPGGGLSRTQRRARLASAAMVGAGYSEVMSFSFVAPGDIAALGLPPDDPRNRPIRIRNPLNEEQALLRTSLLPGLLTALRVNQARNHPSAALFETGLVFLPGPADLPDQPRRLAFAAVGPRPAPRWTGEGPDRDATDAVGVLESLAGALGIEMQIEQGSDGAFHPGRCGTVLVGGWAVGVVGEIHPAVASAFEVTGRVAAGEIDLDAVLAAESGAPFLPPSPLPPVVFDLAFDVDAGVPAGQLTAVVAAAGGPTVESVTLFDVFSGPPLAEGRKSLAVRLTVRDPERTLTDEEVAPLRSAVAAAVAERLDGRLRGG